MVNKDEAPCINHCEHGREQRGHRRRDSVFPSLMRSGRMRSRRESWRFFSSLARWKNVSSTLVLSLAETSMTVMISGTTSHKASASSNSTSRRVSRSHLFPIRTIATCGWVYRRTSSIHLCTLRNDERFVMSYTIITPLAER